MSIRTKRLRFWFTLAIALLLIGGASAGIYHLRQVQAGVTLPVAAARKGEFLVIVRCRGELKARRSVQIYTPLVPSLRIAWLAPSGETVKADDPIVRFDSSTSQQQLQQKEAQLSQAQATLDQAVAQARITAEQDQSDLADARYNVEKARLQVDLQAIKSRIDGQESKIDLGMAEEKLKVEQAAVELHAASNRSKMASLTRVRDQAQADVDLTKARIAQMELKAPINGLLVFGTNYSGGYNNAKPYKVGDNVCSGCPIGEIPDLDTLEIEGKVEEIDRGRILVGQDVRIRADSLPELAMASKVERISMLAELSFEWPPSRSFRAFAAIAHPDSRLRTGMNGGMDIVISRIPNAISIPAKALFTRAGKPIVYLASGGHYRPIEVQVDARNPDEIAVSGIAPGSMVALVDVERKDQKK